MPFCGSHPQTCFVVFHSGYFARTLASLQLETEPFQIQHYMLLRTLLRAETDSDTLLLELYSLAHSQPARLYVLMKLNRTLRELLYRLTGLTDEVGSISSSISLSVCLVISTRLGVLETFTVPRPCKINLHYLGLGRHLCLVDLGRRTLGLELYSFGLGFHVDKASLESKSIDCISS